LAAIHFKQSRQAAMDYPTGFPKHLEQPVDKAIADAEADFGDTKQLLPFIAKVYFAFGRQLCEAVKTGLVTGQAARSQMDSFLHTVIVRTYFDKRTDGIGDPAAFANFEDRTKRRIKESPEWTEYQKAMARALSSNEPLRNPTLELPQRAQTLGKRPRHFREPNLELLKNPEATLNRKNAADALGVAERTLDRWTGKEIIPVGAGSRKRFRTKDLLRLLNQKHRDKVDKTGQE
jgi:hypothetical protein